MRKPIPQKRLSELWHKQHPRTKQPQVRAYITTKQDLNKVASDSLKGRNNLEQNTRGEYGKHNAISPETHNIKGLVIDRGKTKVVLIERGTKRNTTHILKHELNHIYQQRRTR
jgi:hypothetical protein